MPTFEMNSIINDLRRRKNWQQKYMAVHGDHPVRSIARASDKRGSLHMHTFKSYMDTLGLPVDTFFAPYTDNLPINFMQIRSDFLYYIEWASENPDALSHARQLLTQMYEMGRHSTGLNKQLIASCQARLDLETSKDYKAIIVNATNAILTTYPEFDLKTFEGGLLLFEEPVLVYYIARAYAKDAKDTNDENTEMALTIMSSLLDHISRLPHDDRIMHRLRAQILLEISQILIKKKDYAHALEVCNNGFEVSMQLNSGIHCPDFAYNKAKILHEQGQNEEAHKLLTQAYFGFITLRKKNSATKALALADHIGSPIETHGTQDMPMHLPTPTMEHGGRIACNSLGQILRHFRDEAGLSIRVLCKGIVNYSIYAKVERGELQNLNVFVLEALMQRLGRCINLHLHTFVSPREFIEKQLKRKINVHLILQTYEAAKPLLLEFKETQSYKKYLPCKQFAARAEAALYIAANGHNDESMRLLKNAWEITQEKLDINMIPKIRLTNCEAVIANRIAIQLCATNNKKAGMDLYKALLDNMEHFYVDEALKQYLYLTILYNYSREMALTQGDYQYVLSSAKDGEELCIKYMDFRQIQLFMGNKAVALVALGDAKKSVPYLAMTYYTTTMFGMIATHEAVKKYAKEHFDIDFE